MKLHVRVYRYRCCRLAEEFEPVIHNVGYIRLMVADQNRDLIVPPTDDAGFVQALGP